MDTEYVLASVNKTKVKIMLGVYRPILKDFNDFEKWYHLEAKFANDLKDKLERGEVSESDIDSEMFEWSKRQIAEMNERKRKLEMYISMEKKLNRLNEEIRLALKKDVNKCIQLLEELLELNVNSVMLKKNPSIVDTIVQVMEFQYNAPKVTTRKKMAEDRKEVEEMKQLVHNIISKFTEMFYIPDDKSFFEVFAEEKKLFNRQIEYFSAQDMDDLLSSTMQLTVD